MGECRQQRAHASLPRNATMKIFVSYSHKDVQLKNALLEHMASLFHEGVATAWHDREIVAGDAWSREIDNQLEIANVILLLISPSFLASRYCYGVELDRALARAREGEAVVIPILLRPADWKTSSFSHLQALPTNAQPITSWSNSDEAFLDVVTGLRAVLRARPSRENFDRTSAESAPIVSLNYYLYISDQKVDMLLPQVGRSFANHSPVGVPNIDERIRKLDAVNRFIRSHHDVGSIERPASYIAGTCDLEWGHLHRGLFGGGDDIPPLVLFSNGFGMGTRL